MGARYLDADDARCVLGRGAREALPRSGARIRVLGESRDLVERRGGLGLIDDGGRGGADGAEGVGGDGEGEQGEKRAGHRCEQRRSDPPECRT